MKKLFGKIKLSWPLVIVTAILTGIYSAIVAMIPALSDTSFTDINVSFEVWILFGILIIMNSKSRFDSAAKCFVFFLISQPIIYLVQDLFKHSNLFVTYYRNWVLWTIATIPMGFVGYYMKKNKWWGLLILSPILIFLGFHFGSYLSKTIFSMPRHILTTLFCMTTLIIYPLFIFNNMKIKKVGVSISCLIIIIMVIYAIMNPTIYSTEILSSGERYTFDDTYKVYLIDKKYGDLNMVYIDEVETWMVHADFKKAGKTKFVLESPLGKKTTFNITIKSNSYTKKEVIK